MIVTEPLLRITPKKVQISPRRTWESLTQNGRQKDSLCVNACTRGNVPHSIGWSSPVNCKPILHPFALPFPIGRCCDGEVPGTDSVVIIIHLSYVSFITQLYHRSNKKKTADCESTLLATARRLLSREDLMPVPRMAGPMRGR